MRVRWVICLAAAAVLAACNGTGDETGDSTPVTTDGPVAEVPAEVQPLVDLANGGQWRSTGDDTFEVWVCRVPLDVTAAIYGGLPLRLPLSPSDLADVLSEHVSGYFDTLSHGAYRPVFEAGGEVTLGAADEPQACIDDAIAGAGDSARAVLVVADAEHGADQVGGFASGGDSCTTTPPCAVAESRRFAYVGASDFHPDWGDAPPMDLVEHEIGHTLGWQHSAVALAGAYDSGLDLMSNPAAPRAVDDQRRDGPDTLALNRLTAGWLPATDVWVAAASGGSVTLLPSTGLTGTRLAVLPCCDGSYVMIELLTDDGFNDHLPAAGIAVHLLALDVGELQAVTPLFGEPPYTDLLQPGDTLDVNGWLIEVGDGWTITATPATSTPAT